MRGDVLYIVPTLGTLQDQSMLTKENIPGHPLPRIDEGDTNDLAISMASETPSLSLH